MFISSRSVAPTLAVALPFCRKEKAHSQTCQTPADDWEMRRKFFPLFVFHPSLLQKRPVPIRSRNIPFHTPNTTVHFPPLASPPPLPASNTNHAHTIFYFYLFVVYCTTTGGFPPSTSNQSFCQFPFVTLNQTIFYTSTTSTESVKDKQRKTQSKSSWQQPSRTPW